MRREGQRGLAALIGLGVAPGAARAEAHAPPEIFRVLWPDPAHVVLLTNRGLIFGDPAGRDFRLMCNEALDVDVYEKPAIVAFDDGGLLVGTSVGLRRSDDGGVRGLTS